MVVEQSTNLDFIQFWHGAKAQPTPFSELTVVGHVYRVLIKYFYRRVIMHEKNAHFKGEVSCRCEIGQKKVFLHAAVTLVYFMEVTPGLLLKYFENFPGLPRAFSYQLARRTHPVLTLAPAHASGFYTMLECRFSQLFLFFRGN